MCKYVFVLQVISYITFLWTQISFVHKLGSAMRNNHNQTCRKLLGPKLYEIGQRDINSIIL